MFCIFSDVFAQVLNDILIRDENFHDSILEETEPKQKPYSRFTAVSFLIVGFRISLGIGILIGNYLELFVRRVMPKLFSPTLKPEFLFYPPIVVLAS